MKFCLQKEKSIFNVIHLNLSYTSKIKIIPLNIKGEHFLSSEKTNFTLKAKYFSQFVKAVIVLIIIFNVIKKDKS